MFSINLKNLWMWFAHCSSLKISYLWVSSSITWISRVVTITVLGNSIFMELLPAKTIQSLIFMVNFPVPPMMTKLNNWATEQAREQVRTLWLPMNWTKELNWFLRVYLSHLKCYFSEPINNLISPTMPRAKLIPNDKYTVRIWWIVLKIRIKYLEMWMIFLKGRD